MERNLRKTRVGVVVSDKMNNEAGIGDRVEIMETRKISKQVNWRLVKILEKAK